MTGTPDEQGPQGGHDGRTQPQEPPLPGPTDETTRAGGRPDDRPMTIISGPAAQDSPTWRPDAPERGAAQPPARATGGEVARTGSRITSFFSSTQRIGRWRVPPVLTVSGGFSDTLLDLREAVISSSVVEIRLNEIFSSAKVIVPRGVGVDIAGGTGLFSDLKGDYEGVSNPGMWRLTVSHNGAFSSVHIISLDPGESEPKWWKKLF